MKGIYKKNSRLFKIFQQKSFERGAETSLKKLEETKYKSIPSIANKNLTLMIL